MVYRHLTYEHLNVEGRMSVFAPADPSGSWEHTEEYNVTLHTTDPALSYAEQAESVMRALREAMTSTGATPVFVRAMLSDPANQALTLRALASDLPCAVSVIGQAPLNGAKVALWAYMLKAPDGWCGRAGCIHTYSHGEYTHMWTASQTADSLPGAQPLQPGQCSSGYTDTRDLLMHYDAALGSLGCSLADNCLRTWLFVHDVDRNYKGVVEGRNEVFSRLGLTRHTHFIASTGINGCNPNPLATLTMDTYAVKGIAPAQVSYLKAGEYLNPTAEYGVAFERGTAISYGDRRHLYISGTASINNRGEVVAPGDIRRQSLRMMQNVEALIAEGGGTPRDITHMVIYLRDAADQQVVSDFFRARYPDIPRVIVLAAVCRPAWLIEVECMAITAATHPDFAPL